MVAVRPPGPAGQEEVDLAGRLDPHRGGGPGARSYLTYGEPMSMGRRIAVEIKKGIKRDELEKIIT